MRDSSWDVVDLRADVSDGWRLDDGVVGLNDGLNLSVLDWSVDDSGEGDRDEAGQDDELEHG